MTDYQPPEFIPERIVEAEVASDHQIHDTPAFTAHLTRDGETMTVSGYPRVALVVCTFPGVVREAGVGWRDLASAEAFRQRCEREVDVYVNDGWTADPWDVRDGFDRPATF